MDLTGLIATDDVSDKNRVSSAVGVNPLDAQCSGWRSAESRRQFDLHSAGFGFPLNGHSIHSADLLRDGAPGSIKIHYRAWRPAKSPLELDGTIAGEEVFEVFRRIHKLNRDTIRPSA